MRARWIVCALIASVAGHTLGCKKAEEKVRLAGDDKVLAQVNGSAITQYDVEHTARDMLGEHTATRLDEATRKKVLESLVQSRAIAHAREKELTPEERAELEKKVAAYREELLVKQYLVRHTRPSGVTGEMVRQYYEQHPERFGARKERSYELVTVTGTLTPAQRTSVIDALGQAEREQDWAAWVERLKKAGQPVALRRGHGDEGVLHRKLGQLMAQLAVGQASKLTFIDGTPYAVRVTAEREIPPKPLAEVSEEIRKTLAPVKVKDAVKQASAQVLKGTEVAYR